MFETLRNAIHERILLLDGAMGTMIQDCNLSEADFRGTHFVEHPCDLKGNNDLLSITQPHVIKKIHEAYFEAGSDIVETNTFTATSISQADYQTEKWAYQINFCAAKIAKEVAIEFSKKEPHKPRFVAGSMGPTNKTASLSPDVNNPAFRAVSFDELCDSYREETEGLIDGGVDLLLVETVFDTLNCKAALFAIQSVFEEKNVNPSCVLAKNVATTLSQQKIVVDEAAPARNNC